MNSPYRNRAYTDVAEFMATIDLGERDRYAPRGDALFCFSSNCDSAKCADACSDSIRIPRKIKSGYSVKYKLTNTPKR